MSDPVHLDPPEDDDEEAATAAEILEELARLHLRAVALPLPRNPATFGWQAIAGALAAFAAQLLHHVNAKDELAGTYFAEVYRGPLGAGPDPLAVGRWLDQAIARPAGADLEAWAADAQDGAEKASAGAAGPAEVSELGTLLGADALSVLVTGLGASWKAWEEEGDPYRRCIVPGCSERLNIVEAMGGKGGGEGWKMSTAVGYACPSHAGKLWEGDRPHAPLWRHNPAGASASFSELTCSCGWASGIVAFRGHGTTLYQAHTLLFTGEGA